MLSALLLLALIVVVIDQWMLLTKQAHILQRRPRESAGFRRYRWRKRSPPTARRRLKTKVSLKTPNRLKKSPIYCYQANLRSKPLWKYHILEKTIYIFNFVLSEQSNQDLDQESTPQVANHSEAILGEPQDSNQSEFSRKLKRIRQSCVRMAITGRECLDTAQQSAKKLHHLVKKDSFQCVRKSISLFIAFFCLIYFCVCILFAFFREKKIYENLFKFVYDNIEINNPQISALPN